ncbi:MAG: hypothetical protein ACFE8O_00770 [Candidatus Hermodarchaeota archaeon]
MNLVETIKKLPSEAWQALKNYFAGLRLFFNRENWSHSIVFLGTMSFFLIFALFQRPIRNLAIEAGITGGIFIVNIVTVVYLAGIGAFVGFLFLGLIGVFSQGRKVLYESRIRHFMSPLMIGGFIILFVFILPPLLRDNGIFGFLLYGQAGSLGFFQMIFLGCWVVFVFLQVILLGYTVVKSIKWLSGYLQVPETKNNVRKYWAPFITLVILIPIAIWGWFPLVYTFMIIPRPPPVIPEIPIPFYVRLLLEQSPLDYLSYLLMVFPIVAIVAAIVLWQRLPQVSLALASFGIFYPVFVYYYRFRVIQYFHNWSDIIAAVTSPVQGSVYVEMTLLLMTFALALLGAAKLQRGVSPNPFGLFAVMIGVLVFVLSWVLFVDVPVFGLEYYGMITAALSALLAVFVFVILPIAYSIYRWKSFPPTLEEESPTFELSEDSKIEDTGEL